MGYLISLLKEKHNLKKVQFSLDEVELSYFRKYLNPSLSSKPHPAENSSLASHLLKVLNLETSHTPQNVTFMWPQMIFSGATQCCCCCCCCINCYAKHKLVNKTINTEF